MGAVALCNNTLGEYEMYLIKTIKNVEFFADVYGKKFNVRKDDCYVIKNMKKILFVGPKVECIKFIEYLRG